jgi:lipid-A-disaccharide synthase-like uncharacterized protein
MTVLRRTGCVAGAALALAFGLGWAGEAPARPANPQEFTRLLAEAAEAYRQGDLAAARARLREATEQVTPEGDVHRLLLRAGAAYDEGRPNAACSSLLKAANRITPIFWFIVGFLGQVLFTGRFVVQWIVSERQKRSVVPLAFWYLSIGGSLLVLSYALWRLDPVFIVAYAFGSIIYVRNLILIARHRAREAGAAAPAGGAA